MRGRSSNSRHLLYADAYYWRWNHNIDIALKLYCQWGHFARHPAVKPDGALRWCEWCNGPSVQRVDAKYFHFQKSQLRKPKYLAQNTRSSNMQHLLEIQIIIFKAPPLFPLTPSKRSLCTFTAVPVKARLTGRAIYRSACHHVLQQTDFRDGPPQFSRWLCCPTPSPKKGAMLLFLFLPSPSWPKHEHKSTFRGTGRFPHGCSRVLWLSLLDNSFCVWGWVLRPIARIGAVIKLSRGDLSS